MAAHHTMNTKRILLVFTGGTIGSRLTDGTIDTNSAAGFKLLQLFDEQGVDPASVSFKALQPLQILSENLHPGHWQQLIAAIEAEDLRLYDGVIVTHGTDTLAFSAAALGLYFLRLTIPMLLVSSDLPLDDPYANGLPNFLSAVAFIRQLPQCGVFVSYRNPGQSQEIHLATRLASCLQLGSDFISVQAKPFMRFEDGCFRQLQTLTDAQRLLTPLKADFSARILLIRPYPGLDYSQFSLDGVDAVLHDLYHSGTACASAAWGERHSLVEFIRHCRQRNLKVYLAPAIKSESVYGSTHELLAEGAEMIWNLSLEAAYAKLLLAYGNFDDHQAISRFLAQDIAWEHV
jgi:L-asparaginase/Glu-tRNA(Gln) amidotransferase subunit D